MTIFQEPTITDYNKNPPDSDGSQTEDNRITWGKHKEKLGDPIKSGLEALITNTKAAFGKVFYNGGKVINTDYTITVADRGKLLRVSSGPTLTFSAAPTLTDDFFCTIINVEADKPVTIDTNGSETIDLEASKILTNKGDGAIFHCDGSNFDTFTGVTPIIPDPMVIEVGTIIRRDHATSPTGFIPYDEETIGSTVSGAHNPSDDYEALFIYLYDLFPDAIAPVSGGRAASAAASWAANKTIKMPPQIGRSTIAQGQGSGLSEDWSIGETGGEESHVQTEDEVFPHDHDLIGAGGSSGPQTAVSFDSPNSGARSGLTETVGGGEAMNIIHPVVGTRWHIKY